MLGSGRSIDSLFLRWNLAERAAAGAQQIQLLRSEGVSWLGLGVAYRRGMVSRLGLEPRALALKVKLSSFSQWLDFATVSPLSFSGQQLVSAYITSIGSTNSTLFCREVAQN